MTGPHPLPGEEALGGVEVVMETLVRALRDADVAVTVVTCTPRCHRVVSCQADGVTFTLVPTDQRTGRLTWYAAERRAVRAVVAASGADVAHAQGANFYGPATLRAGLPSLVTLHGIHYREARITDRASGVGERLSKRMRGLGNAHFERATLRHAHDLVIISPYVEEAVEGRTSARLHRIPNPVPDAFYGVRRNPVPGQVLFVGSIEPRKNVLTLVKAFRATARHVPGARLRLIGPPKDREYHAAVMTTIAEDGDGRVTYLGTLPAAALHAEYASASVLALPSREESSPLAVQQAMAAGVPVIASRAGGVGALVEDGRTGALVAAGDEADLSARLSALLEDADLDAMGRAARAAAAAFQAVAVATATVAVYAALRPLTATAPGAGR